MSPKGVSVNRLHDLCMTPPPPKMTSRLVCWGGGGNKLMNRSVRYEAKLKNGAVGDVRTEI